MGRGKNKVSCFSLISCAGDGGGDRDDMEPLTEVRDVKSRRRWSFQRRSRNHSLEDVVDQATQDSWISVPAPISSNTNERSDACKNEASSSKVLEMPNPTPPGREEAGSSTLSSSSVNTAHLVSAATAIQTAVRGHLARKELLKFKNVTKLQAVWRGHMVRKQAACTLRCIQAILKMQALVRTRQKSKKEKIDEPEGSVERFQINVAEVDSTGRESLNNGPQRCPPTEKFLQNAFARLISESTPRKKHIHISCDSSASRSAWRWLDVWMAITSSDTNKLEEPVLDADREDKVKKVDSCIASHHTRDVHSLNSIQSGSSSEIKNDQEDDACIVNRSSNLRPQTNQDKVEKETFDSLESPASPEHIIQTAILEDDIDVSYSFPLDSPCKSTDVVAEAAAELVALEARKSESYTFGNVTCNLRHVNSEGRSFSTFLETVDKDSVKKSKGFSESSVAKTSSLQTIPFYGEASSSHTIEQTVPDERQRVSSSSDTFFKNTTSTSESEGSPIQRKTKVKNSATSENVSGPKKNSYLRTKKLTPKTNGEPMAASDTLPSRDNNENASDTLQMEKNELTDHEPRASISNSLPSYMQLTKSARARLHANNSSMTSLDLDENRSHRNSFSLLSGVGKHDTSPHVLLRTGIQGKHGPKGKEGNCQT